MAKCLFPEFLGGADVCVRLGLCEAGRHPLVRDWTCEECTDVLAKVAEFIKDPETVEKGVAYLQGECFCGQMSSPRSLSSSRTQRLLRRESLTSRASASAD